MVNRLYELVKKTGRGMKKAATVGGLVTILSFFPAKGQSEEKENSVKETTWGKIVNYIKNIKGKEQKKPRFKPSIDISTEYSTKCIALGFQLGIGASVQNSVGIGLTDRFSVFGWSSYNFGDKEWHEADIGVEYSFPIGKSGRFSGRIAPQVWTFPSRWYGKYDTVLAAGVNYAGKVNVDTTLFHLFGDTDTKRGDMVCVEVSKPIPVVKSKKSGRWEVSITPKVNGSWADNFYGEKGITQATAGVGVEAKKGAFSVNVSAARQWGFGQNIRSHTYAGAGFKTSF